MPHHRDASGVLHGLEPVVAQLDRWAGLFDQLVLCGPLLDGPPPLGFAPYASPNVMLRPVPRAGGNTLKAKLAMAPMVPVWAWKTRQVARSVDAVHLRCPCNIAMVAIFSTWGAVRYRYAIYAGVWRSYAGEPRFFAYQRRMLASRRFGGPVSVYSSADPARPHLEPFFSPSFDTATWEAAAPVVASTRGRVADPSHSGPWRIIVVGRFTPNKNQRGAIEVLRLLVERGLDVTLDLVGDGPQADALADQVGEAGLADRVAFLGAVDHGEVMRRFGEADLQLLTTFQEGYGKVLLEGMVQGVVPVFSPSPVAEEIAGSGSRGIVIDPSRPEDAAAAIADLVDDRARWLAMIDDARAYTEGLTLEAFETAVRNVLERQWGCDLS